MAIKDPTFTISGSDLLVTLEFDPNASFMSFIQGLNDTERHYAIWISAGDYMISASNFSDRVSLLVDYNNMEEYIAPVGPWSPMSIQFETHPNDDQLTMVNSTCLKNFIEDDLLAVVPFKVDITSIIPFAIEYGISVTNSVTGEVYELENKYIDLTQYPLDSNGIPQWIYNDSRDFKYVSGNDKNWVKINRDSGNDSGSNKAYLSYYGFKIRWEDWLARLGVPSDFFNSSELNNGSNNDWFQYLGITDWDFNFYVYLYAIKNGNEVKYVNTAPLSFQNYNSNTNLTKIWKFYKESDLTPLTVGTDPSGEPLGIILSGEKTRIEVDYTITGNTFTSVSDYYGTICIEVFDGAGEKTFRQLSTVIGSESDNPLVPITGQTKCKITLVSSTLIKLECDVEPSLLINASKYKLTSRLCQL